MELRQLGTTGMRVSELGLGTMTWGRDTDEIDAAEQFRDFLDAGGTLIDTSASYADGTSEEVVGSLLAEVRRALPRLVARFGPVPFPALRQASFTVVSSFRRTMTGRVAICALPRGRNR